MIIGGSQTEIYQKVYRSITFWGGAGHYSVHLIGATCLRGNNGRIHSYLYLQLQLQLEVYRHAILSIKQRYNVLAGPEDKGASFAANSPENVFCEKILKNFF
jgi:hypothetical protein